MKCPRCKNLETRVIDSRLSEDGLSIRRRRECESCQARFTTFERMEFVNFLVTKSSGKKELYNRSKIETSILKACNKRNIPQEKISIFHHWLILHGRYVCTARNPKCMECGIREYCKYFKKNDKS